MTDDQLNHVLRLVERHRQLASARGRFEGLLFRAGCDWDVDEFQRDTQTKVTVGVEFGEKVKFRFALTTEEAASMVSLVRVHQGKATVRV